MRSCNYTYMCLWSFCYLKKFGMDVKRRHKMMRQWKRERWNIDRNFDFFPMFCCCIFSNQCDFCFQLLFLCVFYSTLFLYIFIKGTIFWLPLAFLCKCYKGSWDKRKELRAAGRLWSLVEFGCVKSSSLLKACRAQKQYKTEELSLAERRGVVWYIVHVFSLYFCFLHFSLIEN